MSSLFPSAKACLIFATLAIASAAKVPSKTIPPKRCGPGSKSSDCTGLGAEPSSEFWTFQNDSDQQFAISDFTFRPLKIRPHDRAGEQLIEDLLFTYNKNVRPIENASHITNVTFAASLIRIIDLNEKTQQLTTNLWLDVVSGKSDEFVIGVICFVLAMERSQAEVGPCKIWGHQEVERSCRFHLVSHFYSVILCFGRSRFCVGNRILYYITSKSSRLATVPDLVWMLLTSFLQCWW